MNKQELGKGIRDIRIEKQLSVYRVVKKTKLQAHQIAAIEKGEGAYTIDSLLKILDALEVEIKI